MSGHKRTTVTISQDEYRRLYEAERKNYYDLLAIPETSYQNTVVDSQKTLYDQFSQIASRQSRYEAVCDALQSQIRDVEKNTSRSLVEQQTEFYNKLLSTSQNIWEDASTLIAVQTQNFINNVESQHHRLQEQVFDFEARLNTVYSDMDRTYETAVSWIEDAQELMEFIVANYPREVVDIRQEEHQLVIARSNLQSGIFQAALALSQQSFVNLSEKRLIYERELANRAAMVQALKDHLALLMDRILDHSTVKGIDLDGNEVEPYLNVDYWTGGELSKLKEKVMGLMTYIAEHGIHLDLQETSHLFENVIPELTNEFVEAVHSTRRKALNSQIRFNIAQLVLTSAIQQGYQPESGQYIEDDYRNEYAATAKSPDGNTITVRVRPDGEYDHQVLLDNSSEAIRSEPEMKRRMQEILSGLQLFGMNMGSIESYSAKPASDKTRSMRYVAEKKSSYAYQRS